MKVSAYKVYVTVIIMVLALAAATTTTFAWVSMNQNAKVDSFSLQIKGSDKLLISADGVNYFDYLTIENFDSVFPRTLIDQNGLTYGRFSLDAVTPLLDHLGNPVFDDSNEPVFIALDNASGTYVQASAYNKTDLTGSYFKFKLYFKADKPYDITVGYIDMASSPSNIGSDSALSPFSFNQSIYSTFLSSNILANEAIPALAQNAARIAFKSDYTRLSSSGAYFIMDTMSAYGYNKGNLARDYYNYMYGNPWDISGDSIPIGCSDAEYDASGSSNKYIRETDIIEANGLLTYDYKNTEIVRLVSDGNGSYLGSTDVYFWLEGKDGDCFDSVLKDTFLLSMKFDGLLIE